MNALRNTFFSLTTLILSASVAGAGCVGDPGDEGSADGKPESNGKLVDGKADAWNWTNNPDRFQVDFNYNFFELPESGAAAVTPWPDTYWPTYKDSTNQRWQGQQELSPLEKYDAAFNGWSATEEFMELRPFEAGNCDAEWDTEYYEQLGPAAKYASDYKGNKKARDGVDSDGDGEVDECDDNDGVESWWGLCHAWVPAAMLEKEPQRSVTHNGVTFDVGDIKALLITQYDRTSAYMLGGRCNEKEVERDEHGRIKASHCRDTNAGAFHVVAANMLGVYNRSFAEDRTYDYEVWNQPLRDFEVLSKQEVSAQEAMAALGQADAESSSYNEEATRFAKVRTKVRYITEPHQSSTEPLVPAVENNDSYTGSDTYEYILELNDEGEILGGEWLGYSQASHPDFLWLPTVARSGNPHVNIDLVRELLELSTQPEDPSGGDDGEIRTFESSPELSIPDNEASGVSDTITVSDDMPIGSLKVAVEIDHSYIGDLRVVLEKDGVTVPLHDRVGGGADDIHKTYEVTDFAGGSAKGTWTLHVSDHAGWDKGKLKSWNLVVSSTPAEIPTEYAAQDTPISIPDNDDDGILSTLNVSEAGVAGNVRVEIALTHTYIGDLTLTLSHGGASQVLHGREGGSANDIRKTFETPAFSGAPIEGEWTLQVTDEAGWDVGTLDAWKILVTAP